MWTKLRTSKAATNQENLHRTISINTEYLSAFRTQSYLEFFDKAQFLVTGQPSNSPKASELLLQPQQDSIPSLLDCLSTHSDLKLLIQSYFDNSAEASRICTDLLRSINTGHDTYRFINNSLDSFSTSSPNDLNPTISKLSAFTKFNNPFASLTQKDFKIIHDKYGSILQRFKSKKKQVIRQRKVVEYSKKAAGVCLIAGCAVHAVAAIGIAMHSVTGHLTGQTIIGVFPSHLRTMWRKMRNPVLRKAGDQIDAAAKGTYIMDREFDTMSRLVYRLHDEMERIKCMITILVVREDRFSQHEIVKELRRSGRGLKKLVEELEENVCLCLMTINRARLSVIDEIATV